MKRKNIVLCGFMGSGKSTIGNLLSKKMGMAFIDLDAYIEKKENKSVSQIFADSGEEYFRQLEKDAVGCDGSLGNGAQDQIHPVGHGGAQRLHGDCRCADGINPADDPGVRPQH